MVWQPAEGGSAVSATEWAEGAEGADEAVARGRRRWPRSSLVRGRRGGRGGGRGRGRVDRGAEERPRRGGRRRRPSSRRRRGRRGRGGSGIAPRADLHRVPPDPVRPTPWCGWCASGTARWPRGARSRVVAPGCAGDRRPASRRRRSAGRSSGPSGARWSAGAVGRLRQELGCSTGLHGPSGSAESSGVMCEDGGSYVRFGTYDIEGRAVTAVAEEDPGIRARS